MTPFKLVAQAGDTNENINPSIQVFTNSGNCHLCDIWADGKVTFDNKIDYDMDEVKAIQGISDNFFSIYNSLMECEKLIHELTDEVQTLLHSNPVIERQ